MEGSTPTACPNPTACNIRTNGCNSRTTLAGRSVAQRLKFIRCTALQPSRDVRPGETRIVYAKNVRVRAARQRQMVGEELQRHETGQGAERLGDFGHSEKIRRLLCTIADDEAGGAPPGHQPHPPPGAP